MGAAGSKLSTAGRDQIPSLSPYRMPDSAPIQANPLREAMKTRMRDRIATGARMPDQLNEFGDSGAEYMKQRFGEMQERQDLGDELGGMGSQGGVNTALVNANRKRMKRQMDETGFTERRRAARRGPRLRKGRAPLSRRGRNS